MRNRTEVAAFRAVLVAVLLVSCAREKTNVQRDESTVLAAEATVSTYLRQAVMLASRMAPDSLQVCAAYGGGDPQVALAKGRVLGSALKGDTAMVRAEVVTVARVTLSPDGPYEVREAVKTDTLSWALIRPAGSARWGICGFSREGVGFVRPQYLGPTARWLNGASLASVTKLADSVARAQ